MKINLIDYIKKVGDTTSLSALEREKLEGVLTEYMAMKPIRGVSASTDARPTKVRGGLFSSLFFIHSKKKYMPVAIILGLLLSGTASYAAEGTMPGDLLYPVKVGVNEKVGSALALSAESKATLEAKFAERRLSEATNLVADKKLSAEVRAKLLHDFAKHADAVAIHTKELDKKNTSAAIDHASNFESNLAAHEAILAEINVNGDTDDFVNLIRTKTLAVGKFRADAEGRADVGSDSSSHTMARDDKKENEHAGMKSAVAFGMGENAKGAIKTTTALLGRVSGNLDASAVVNAKAQLATAGTLILKGDAFFAEKHFAEAFRAYQDALVTAKRLSVYLEASHKVRVNIFHPTKGSQSDERADEQKNESAEKTQKHDDAAEPKSTEGHGRVEIDSEIRTGSVHIRGSGSVDVGL